MSRDGALAKFLRMRLRPGMRTCSHYVVTAADSADGALARSQAARRRRVIDATLELAAGGGFDGVQMRDVAAEAGVALGTVYRYFESKERLLLEANLEQVDALRERITELAAEVERAHAELAARRGPSTALVVWKPHRRR